MLAQDKQRRQQELLWILVAGDEGDDHVVLELPVGKEGLLLRGDEAAA